MKNKPQRLELTWIDKEVRPLLEPRILLEDQEKSYHAKLRNGKKDQFENKLIFGDNLLALKSLEQKYTGKVKCVYIDPPYNTGSAFEHYDDGIEHSLWLGLMRHRLELLKRLLREDGSIWINLDDNEAHYCKVMCDELFGRNNFVADIAWQKKYSPQANTAWLSDAHDHILCFAKNKAIWHANLLPRSEAMDARYRNLDNDPRGAWKPGDFTISLTGGQRGMQFAKTGVSANIYEITTPSGRKLLPVKGRCWAASPERFKELVKDNRIWFGTDGNNVPSLKRFLSEVQDGIVATTWWTREEADDNQKAKREVKEFNSEEIFATPKPERLIKRVLEIATNPGDLVLDSFAGSGTTGAVAHKMGRKWIMVELGEHCHTHILPRLKKVVDGDDPGGVTKETGWEGGGGFRYFKLAPSLLKKDHHGMWIINKEYNAEMLAEAICKIEGFTYDPSDTVYWQHGRSTETDYIYVTTQYMGPERLVELSEEVGKKKSLLVLCKAYRTGSRSLPNLTVKKIPQAVLAQCEWDHDDYSLKIENLPKAPKRPKQRSLFDLEGGKQ